MLSKNLQNGLNKLEILGNIELSPKEPLFLDSKNKLSGLHIFINSLELDNFDEFTKSFSPWRKGPYYLHFINKIYFLDTEWRSYLKIEKILQIFKQFNMSMDGKSLLDIGCNNAYYMISLISIFRDVREFVGIEPMENFFLQYKFIEYFLPNFIREKINFKLMGINDLPLNNATNDKKIFDILLCMGVLYHRSDPIGALKCLKDSMSKTSILFLETLIILDSKEVALIPQKTYAGMKNVFFIFSPKSLQNIAFKAGFSECELIMHSIATNFEQRSTDFAKNSLGDYLNNEYTIEGYGRVLRGFFYLKI